MASREGEQRFARLFSWLYRQSTTRERVHVRSVEHPQARRNQTLVASSVMNRAPIEQDDKANLIEVTYELKDSITGIYSMKSKWMWGQIIIIFIATKGRANYLLKKSSILSAPRKSSKKYEADLSQIVNYRPVRDQRKEVKEER